MVEKNINTKGQSVLEVIFSIGIIALVVTGSISLIVNSISLRSKGFQRSVASDMANLVISDLVEQKRNNESSFWLLENKSEETLTNFEGFIYSIDYNSTDLSCNDCTNVVVTVNWAEEGELKVNRFFSKGVN